DRAGVQPRTRRWPDDVRRVRAIRVPINSRRSFEIGRGQMAAAVLVILAVLLSAWLLTHRTSVGAPATSAEPTTSAVAEPSAAATPAVTAAATPEGTPAPIPSEATAISAEIKTPPPPPNPTETPAPQAGLWRVDGYVVDSDGKPLERV